MTVKKIFLQFRSKLGKIRVPMWVWVFILLVLGTANVIFALRTNSYFSVDDFALLASIKRTSFLGMAWEFLIKGDPFGFRKVVGYVVFRGVFEAFGTNATAFIFTNYLFHLANLFLVFFLAKKLTKRNLPAFLAALIFDKFYLFYFSNIHEYVVTFLCLSTILVFLKFPKEKLLALGLFVLALLTKEMAFSVPLFLLALSLTQKIDRKRLRLYFLVLGAYFLYQGYFYFAGRLLPQNASYEISFSLGAILGGVKYYLGWWLFGFLLVLPILTKKLSTYWIFLVGLITLFPALLLPNRHEIYYFYLPVVYLLWFIGLNIPKDEVKAGIVVILTLLLFGGKSVLPSVAWYTFPNWQKVSLLKVVDRVEGSLEKTAGNAEIKIGDIKLERDARLMLESGVVDLFVQNQKVKDYSFVYKPQSSSIVASRK